MTKLKKVLGRAGMAVGTVAIIIAGSAAFSAFEAHIVNVTATIENALSVDATAIDYGTVFPQQHLTKPLTVALSTSFLNEPSVDDVSYFIRQKPKCGITNADGTGLVDGSTVTGELTAFGGVLTTDCGPTPELTGGQIFGVLPSLCPYLSKEADGTPANDTSLSSFHVPFSASGDTVVYNDALGHLAKSESDLSDTWTIDLAVPTFQGQAAQDWLSFVRGITGNPDMTLAEANVFQLNPADEHKVFGCDLWVEVSDVSQTVPPGTLTVTKVINNGQLGGAVASDFSFAVNSGASTSFDVSGTNVMNETPANYSVVESANADYTTTYSNSANANTNCDNLPVVSSANVTCTITNTHNEGTLTVTKVVDNTGGGTAEVSDFDIRVDALSVTSGDANAVTAGAHIVSEVPDPDYSSAISGDCDGSGNVTVPPGGFAACTITNTFKL